MLLLKSFRIDLYYDRRCSNKLGSQIVRQMCGKEKFNRKTDEFFNYVSQKDVMARRELAAGLAAI